MSGHYFLFVLTCLFAAFFVTQYSSSLLFARLSNTTSIFSFMESGTEHPIFHVGDLAEDIGEAGGIAGFITEKLSDYEPSAPGEAALGGLEVAYKDGVFAQVVSSLYSGTFIIQIGTFIQNVINEPTVSSVFTLIGVALLVLFLWLFISNVYETIMKRIFMEGGTYKDVSVSRFLFLYQHGAWINAARVLAYRSLFFTLWMLTVVGGLIKRYSYTMVPYILAENPNVKPKEALQLSQRMMDGHKLECFKLDMSFIGWQIVNVLTAGISGLLFTNPYRESTRAAYYKELRSAFLETSPQDRAILLNDIIFEPASHEELEKAYADIEEIKESIPELPERRKGLWGIIESNLGIIKKYDERDRQFDRFVLKTGKYHTYMSALEQETYPLLLSPVPIKKRELLKHPYLRHYSLPSFFALFFIYSVLGWLWEVILHYITVGDFVNRGFLHGPWLPIYGVGVVLSLSVLYRVRHRPPIFFLASMFFCGTLEYYSSVIIELRYGVRWWDYTGYFINLNGRICAEGILMFGVGCTVFTYIVSPLLDDLLRKVKSKVLIAVCIILTGLFITDTILSSRDPNSGKGITSQESTGYTAPSEEETSFHVRT